jgi:hypothetical protein
VAWSTLRFECEIDVATDETDMPSDAQARQPSVSRVLKDRLWRNAPQEHAELRRGEQRLVESS